MIDLGLLRETMCNSLIIKASGDGVRVSTHCLYPSNNTVVVTVRGGGDQFVVSDDGGALDEVAGAGRREGGTDKQLRLLVGRQGLKVQNGVIYSPPVSLEVLPAAILLVSNAAKEVADWGLKHIRFTVTRNFKETLTEILKKHFHDNLKNDQHIPGASTKPHKFGHIVYLKHDRKLLIDPVVNDASSINARVVANMDIKMLNDNSIEQMIVYDDRLDWSSSDLTLLKVGAPIVPFSYAEAEIQRRAA